MKKHLLAGLMTLALAVPIFAHEGHMREHGKEGHQAATKEGASTKSAETSETITVKGEILDMACYIDHGATGAKHADCAKTCIESGLPVGIKAEDGKVYLLIGEHKPLNKTLAAYAAKTVTVTGKAVGRDGFHMIENAEIVP